MTLLIGSIADDFTGATDLASTLVKAGARTVQLLGAPAADAPPPEADAVVVALKSRTIPAADAVADSLRACDWLTANGARQIIFKYCSTFDSTAEGNIGPVAEALMKRLGVDFTIACPAFPATGRTIYRGHLFVGDLLLSDSPMKDHPLTPMTDANLARALDAQLRDAPGAVGERVGVATMDVVAQGPDALRAAFDSMRAAGQRFAIVDAIRDADLLTIGAACKDMRLITGGSGIAMGLPANFGLSPGASAELPAVAGPAALFSGSCSAATRAQVARALNDRPGFRLDPLTLAAGRDPIDAARAWLREQLAANTAPLIYATAEPDAVRAAQAELGRMRAGEVIEEAMAELAADAADAGARRIVVAGGETSGAVVQALGVTALRIGPEIAPGVPATVSAARDGGGPELALALKSGNFGAESFFADALRVMP